MNTIFKFFIKSDFVKAQILAIVRHVITSIGTAMALHGLANNDMIQAAIGLGTAAVSFYLSQLDVKGVDKKIQLALATPTPEQADEKEVTRMLNSDPMYNRQK